MRRIVMLLVGAVAVLGNSNVVIVKVPALIGMEERPARILLAEKEVCAPTW